MVFNNDLIILSCIDCCRCWNTLPFRTFLCNWVVIYRWVSENVLERYLWLGILLLLAWTWFSGVAWTWFSGVAMRFCKREIHFSEVSMGSRCVYSVQSCYIVWYGVSSREMFVRSALNARDVIIILLCPCTQSVVCVIIFVEKWCI